jgi:hypothetical protein
VDNLTVSLRPGEGKNQYTSYEWAFNKQNSKGWSFLASYDVSLRHENATDPETPNALFYRTDVPIWDQGIKMNGTYALPYGLQWSSTFSAQSGSPFNRGVQIRNADNSNVTQTIAASVDRYPWVNVWDQRFTKKFKIGDKQSVEAYYEMFNTTNVNTVTSQGTTIGLATFKGSDGSLYKPSAIISPRISQFTVKYRF